MFIVEPDILSVRLELATFQTVEVDEGFNVIVEFVAVKVLVFVVPVETKENPIVRLCWFVSNSPAVNVKVEVKLWASWAVTFPPTAAIVIDPPKVLAFLVIV